MKQTIRHMLARLTAFVMTAALLTGCSLPGIGSRPTAETETTVSQDYEAYTEASLLLQKKFDQLTDHLFREEVVKSAIDLHYTLADPAAYGITETPTDFGEFSLSKMAEDEKELRDLKNQLATIDWKQLTNDQQLTYQILTSYISTELSSSGMELYYQPVTPTIGVQAQLPILLSEYAFYSRQDVENYLTLLSHMDEYYNQILEFEKAKAAAGLFMTDTSIDHVIDSCQGYLLTPEHSFLTETFASRLAELPDITAEDQAAYIARNEQMLTEHFIPAYQNLVDGMNALRGSGTIEGGLSNYPDGRKYYEYLVRSNTGTSYKTVDDLKDAIERKMNDDLTEASKILKANPGLYDQLDTYQFKQTEPEQILADLQAQIPRDFPELPACNYKIKHVPKSLENTLSPAFYLTPPLDKYQDNVIYINDGDRAANTDLYTTLAHEGYPGHLYQTVYFSHNNKCDLRKLLPFTSYSEGWATYVEYYAFTLDNGLDPELGKLMAHTSAATLALHALLDIQVNYYGWTRDQVAEYLGNYYDVEGSDVVNNMYYAVIENPTNYLEYYVGYLEIENLRQKAEKKLGSRFDLKDFHKFILDIGPAPFDVIQNYFNSWLLSK